MSTKSLADSRQASRGQSYRPRLTAFVGGMLCKLAFLTVLCAPVFAQNVAAISGTVPGIRLARFIAGAEVKLTQTDTSYSRTVRSDATGAFAAVNSPTTWGRTRWMSRRQVSGPYHQNGIVLEVNSNPKFNVVMTLGNVSAEVTVEASSAMVEAVSNAIGQVMDNKSVLDLPLAGRQVTDLLLLSAGAVQSGTVSNRGYPVIPIAISGGGVGNNLYLLDGATHNDPATSINIPVPFPDALQEFKVEDSFLPARYGQHAAPADQPHVV